MKTILICALSALSLGCGSKLYLNKSYQYENPNRSIKLAMIPAPGDDGQMSDSLFTYFFEDSTGAQVLVESKTIRDQIVSDTELLTLLNKLLTAEYNKDDLKSGVNIANSLTPDEFATLKQRLGNPDLALLPLLGYSSFGNMTLGDSKFRLFDMQNGSLIYENSQGMNVNVGGDNGKMLLAIMFIGGAKTDYQRHFLDRFVK